jgi:hypothetical protein
VIDAALSGGGITGYLGTLHWVGLANGDLQKHEVINSGFDKGHGYTSNGVG